MSGTIEITNFSKSYGSVRAVEEFSLKIESGELFGLIGPDGAGKTTTMRTLCTLLNCDHGEMLVDGRDVRSNVSYIRSILGYMPQRFSLYPDLSVEQNLNFFADLFGVPKHEKEDRLTRLYQFSKLEPFKKRLASALSGGMKQKLALSCTLIHTPRILILDDATSSVDTLTEETILTNLRTMRRNRTTLIVTHRVSTARQADRILIMANGRVVESGRHEDLLALGGYYAQLYHKQLIEAELESV